MTARTLLNERFKEIFYHLEQRGDVVKNCREKGMSSFAEKIMQNKQSGHIVRKYLKEQNKRNITYDQANRLVKFYKVRKAFLFEGEGPMFEDEQLLPSSPVQQIGFNSFNDLNTDNRGLAHGNITFSSVAAFASNTFSVHQEADTEKFHIPHIQGEHIAFYINGNSMSPTIENGDLIICKSVEMGEKIDEKKIYAVVLIDGTVLIKRIKLQKQQHNQTCSFKLISDNYLEHDPFEIDATEIRKLMRVERKLTSV